MPEFIEIWFLATLVIVHGELDTIGVQGMDDSQ